MESQVLLSRLVGVSLCKHMPEPSFLLRQQSRESSKQRGAEPGKAAEKLRSDRSEESNPGRPSLSSPQSKLQDIAEEGQRLSSAESAAASHASSSRQAGLSVLPAQCSPEKAKCLTAGSGALLETSLTC